MINCLRMVTDESGSERRAWIEIATQLEALSKTLDELSASWTATAQPPQDHLERAKEATRRGLQMARTKLNGVKRDCS